MLLKILKYMATLSTDRKQSTTYSEFIKHTVFSRFLSGMTIPKNRDTLYK